MYIIKKSSQKLKALKIETSWGKKVVKPVFGCWNARSDIIIYVCLFHSLIKIFKNMQGKKE